MLVASGSPGSEQNDPDECIPEKAEYSNEKILGFCWTTNSQATLIVEGQAHIPPSPIDSVLSVQYYSHAFKYAIDI